MTIYVRPISGFLANKLWQRHHFNNGDTLFVRCDKHSKFNAKRKINTGEPVDIPFYTAIEILKNYPKFHIFWDNITENSLKTAKLL